MASIYQNVLSEGDLNYLNDLTDVLAAKATLDARPSGMVYFSVPVTESIRGTLQSRFGLNLSLGSSMPMRWIKGDIKAHVDRGRELFQHTYLVYLNDSSGEFIVDSEVYPIQANTGFVFDEGLTNETRSTGTEPRLLLGPMNEYVEPVGGPAPGVHFFRTEQDALANQNPIYSDNTYRVRSLGITSWLISDNSTGTSPRDIIYHVEDTVDADPPGAYYTFYPGPLCFLEGTTILCKVNGVEKYESVEKLTKGTMVKTRLSGFKPVVLIGKSTISNPGNDERTENRLYKCSPAKYPDLTKDLFITGCHSILEFPITEKQKEDTIKHLGKLYVTEKKYRLMACIDERAEPWNSKGNYTIWHFALEHDDEKMNYGVYANGGLLVETTSIRFLKNKSNMSLA